MPVWTERPPPRPSRSAVRARVLALPRFSDLDRRLARRLPALRNPQWHPSAAAAVATPPYARNGGPAGAARRERHPSAAAALGTPPKRRGARLSRRSCAARQAQRRRVAGQDRPRPARQARSGVPPLRALPASRRRETRRGDSRVLDVTGAEAARLRAPHGPPEQARAPRPSAHPSAWTGAGASSNEPCGAGRARPASRGADPEERLRRFPGRAAPAAPRPGTRRGLGRGAVA
jgi:hypothetical protein